jgi:hypothetical protein
MERLRPRRKLPHALSALKRREKKKGESHDDFMWGPVNMPNLIKDLDPLLTPGPGAYNVSRSSLSNRAHYIQARKPFSMAKDTVDSELVDLRRFPESKGVSIGLRRSAVFSKLERSPGPYMSQPATIQTMPIRIGIRPVTRFTNGVPGPGEYNPYAYERLRSSISMGKGSSERFIWPDSDRTPGPGAYNITKQLGRPKKWSRKLRNVKPVPVIQLDRYWRKKILERELAMCEEPPPPPTGDKRPPFHCR